MGERSIVSECCNKFQNIFWQGLAFQYLELHTHVCDYISPDIRHHDCTKISGYCFGRVLFGPSRKSFAESLLVGQLNCIADP